MQFGLINSLNEHNTECLVLGLLEDSFSTVPAGLDAEHARLTPILTKRLHEAGDSLWQIEVNGRALFLLHCGKQAEFNETVLKKRLLDILTALVKHKIQSATIVLPQLADRSADWQLTQMILLAEENSYLFSDYKTQKKDKQHLKKLDFYLPSSTQKTLSKATMIAEGIQLARRLADMPANYCTPSFLGEEAKKLANLHPSIKTTVHGLQELKELKMGCILAVGQGSVEQPRLIELSYQGGREGERPIVLVGKGITFDSGGLSIKPANAMDEMKYDMAGAASVFGCLKACALLELPIHVIGLIPSAENLPSGTAVKPGDIITSYSGQTIEVLNTDAEGRLILADALSYAERYNPDYVVDIATLTGAMVVALGQVNTGFMSNDEVLAEHILRASKESGDKVWRLPMDEEYQEALESPLADMINASFDRNAGAITAACFLSRFTKKFRWAHLDIAGTAWVSGKKRKATGRPVPLLVQLLHDLISSR